MLRRLRTLIQRGPSNGTWKELSTLSEASLGHVQQTAVRLLKVRAAQIILLTGGGQSPGGDRPEQTAGASSLQDTPFIEHALAASGAFMVKDAARDPRFARHALVQNAPRIRFFAGVPLRASDGRALGVLCLMDSRPRTLRSKECEVLDGLATMATDIVSMQRLSGELQKTQDDLSESQRMLFTLLGNLPGMAYRCRNEPDWPMEFVSEGARALTGHDPDTLVYSTEVQYGELIHPDDREAVWQEVQAALDERLPFQVTYRLRTAKAEEKWVWEQGRGIFSAKGTLLAVEGFIMDVTAHKQHEAELLKAKEEAEQLDHLKSALLTNMSHEIRTPLAGVLGFAELLLGDLYGTLEEAQREAVLEIRHGGERLLETLNSVLDLAMIESGTVPLLPESFDVGEHTREVLRRFGARARSKGLALHLALPEEPVLVRLDRSAFAQSMAHVVGNAIKFTEHGEVRVRVARADASAIIVVEDTGIGISPSFRPNLFEAFRQESTGLGRSYEGMGLGLTVAKKLVEVMGGVIEVVSEPGRGSRFTLSFPLPAVPASQSFRSAAPLPGRSPAQPWARVLAVEDSASMRFLLEQMLGEMPEVHLVATAGDDEEALRLAREQHFDAFVLDINLRRARTGEDVLQELRQFPEYARSPMIAMTAYALPGDRERFLSAGFDAYLGKPFDPESLQETLAQLLYHKSPPGEV